MLVQTSNCTLSGLGREAVMVGVWSRREARTLVFGSWEVQLLKVVVA